jgi:hypothetical protein
MFGYCEKNHPLWGWLFKNLRKYRIRLTILKFGFEEIVATKLKFEQKFILFVDLTQLFYSFRALSKG